MEWSRTGFIPLTSQGEGTDLPGCCTAQIIILDVYKDLSLQPFIPCSTRVIASMWGKDRAVSGCWTPTSQGALWALVTGCSSVPVLSLTSLSCHQRWQSCRLGRP